MRKIALLSRFLTDYEGHFYNFSVNFLQGLVQVFGNVEANVIVPNDCKISDAEFRKILPANPKELNIASKFRRFKFHIHTAKTYARIIEELQNDYDIIIFPDGYDYILLSSLIFLDKFKTPMFFYVHSCDDFFGNFLYKRRKNFLKRLWKTYWKLRFTHKKKANVYFLTYNDQEDCNSDELRIVELLQKGNSKVVFSAPCALLERYASSPSCDSSDKELTISYLGVAVIEKGFDKVVEVINYFKPRAEKAKFLVSCYVPKFYNNELLFRKIHELQQLKKENPSLVEIIDVPLSFEEYTNSLKHSSILLLLYDNIHYKRKLSGVLLEAFAYGKPVITMAGTWLAKQVEKYGGGIIVQRPEPPVVAKAIEEIIDNYARYQAQAIEAGRQLVQKHNSVELARLIKQLLGDG